MSEFEEKVKLLKFYKKLSCWRVNSIVNASLGADVRFQPSKINKGLTIHLSHQYSEFESGGTIYFGD